MKTVTTTRVVLDKEERAIAKSWGSDWDRIKSDIKKFGRACILTGEWSGYNAGQRRICHTEYSRNDHSRGMALKSIVFTDGTNLRVEIRAYTMEQIFEWKIERKRQYDQLVREAREAMVETFYIGQDNAPDREEKKEEIAQPQVMNVEPGFSEDGKLEEVSIVGEDAKNYKDKIKAEQMGKNWYDR